ncbi:MAG: hypothetical protein LQ341_002068 [Variospora aurantia]|nr:MAG: hypothetical protein LQ341_002068 [Variospora aurantia]
MASDHKPLLASMMLHDFFTGLGYLTMVIVLPQKFQAVNGDGGFKSWILTPCTHDVILPRGHPVEHSYGDEAYPTFLHLHRCELPPDPRFRPNDLPPNHTAEFPARAVRYATIMGFVFGLSISTLIMMAQARTLGGTLSISICANLLNKHIKHALKKVLSPQQIIDLLGSARWIAGFPEDVRPVVKRIYAEEYRDQAITLTAFAGAKLLVVGMMWERRLRRMSKKV